MKKIFSIFAAILFAGSMMAATYTLGWGEATGTAGTYTNFTATSGSVSGIVSFTTAKNGASTAPAYNSNNKDLRLYYGSGGNGGSITLTPAEGVTITGFVMTTSTSPSVKYTVDGGAATSVSASSNTYTVSGISATTSLMIQNVNTTNTQLRIKTIEITYTAAAATKCEAPTFSVEEGTFYDASIEVELACTTEGAAIHYTLDGTAPTASSTLYENAIEISETTTIKAIAVKDGLDNSDVASATYTKGETVEGYEIDFEKNALIPYVNWEFTNIAIASTAITAHGGSFYGNTSGKASAAIVSKAPIALPGDLTFYTSKESGNTTSSNWDVEISADKEEWTRVARFSATTGDKGEWTKREADLSAYKNVYVRISYAGSTAIRAIDDITLADAVEAKVATPAFSVPAGEYAEAQSVELSCETEGAAIYYTLDGTDPTASSTLYENAIELDERAVYTIKVIAIKGDDKSKIASATYNINLPYTLTELVAADLNDPSTVNVVLANETIKDFYIYNEKRAGVIFDIQKDDKDIKIYFNNQTTIVDWEKGGKLSGTILNATWKTFSSAWQIAAPTSGFKWADLNYVAPSDPTALDNTNVEEKTVKFFENGQLVIIKNGVRYNAQGALIR